MADDLALITLGRWLVARRYRFVTPTPATHARVNARPVNAWARGAEAHGVEDVLGWSRPFRPGSLPEVEHLLDAGGALIRDGAWLRSAVRCSTLDEPRAIFVHSAFPTHDAASVFFGPDTYRFVAALRRVLRPARRLVDVGCGCGAGGLAVRDRAEQIVLADINPGALRLARINAALAGAEVELVESDVLAGVDGQVDAIIANPPYLADRERRTYRDGGGELGIGLSVRIVRDALARLAPGGQLVLYTGSPVIDGAHPLRDALAPLIDGRAHHWDELDPDVFGEELDAAPYDRVDRIAVVTLVVDT